MIFTWTCVWLVFLSKYRYLFDLRITICKLEVVVFWLICKAGWKNNIFRYIFFTLNPPCKCTDSLTNIWQLLSNSFTWGNHTCKSKHSQNRGVQFLWHPKFAYSPTNVWRLLPKIFGNYWWIFLHGRIALWPTLSQ